MLSKFSQKRGNDTIQLSHLQSEAALAQSDFNIEKITEIQNRFAGGMVCIKFPRHQISWN